MLKDVKLEISYSSDSGNMVNDFYVPCMSNSIIYRRAVGYFTSHGLSVAAQGIAHLIKNEGNIQLIASPCLTDEDIAAIETGHKKRLDKLAEAASRSFSDIENILIQQRLTALAWLIESGALDVKLAIRINKQGKIKRGIFHEKMGIFSDVQGEHVAFSGSPNETVGGLIENYENIDVFWSWDDPQKRVSKKLERFESLWKNSTHGLEVIQFTEVSKELLKKYRSYQRPERDPEEVGAEMPDGGATKVPGGPSMPDLYVIRDYQEQGIKNWFKNNGRGIFKFATGTGKTITALAAATKLFQIKKLDAVVIVCPFKHLVNQWAKEARNFGMRPILAFESRGSWETDLTLSLLAQGGEGREFIAVITTNKTFSEALQGKLPHFPNQTMLIADEVHNLGSEKLLSSLPDSAMYRLGLSATPERQYDSEGTERLFIYFGPILDPQIGLKEAIELGVLTPYRYYPILVPLTDEESEEYVELSEKIGRILLYGKKDDEDDNPILTALLVRRARLIASAANKMSALQELMEKKRTDSHMLVYCGDGTVDDPTSLEDSRQIDAVCKILGRDLGIMVAPFVAETSAEEREELISNLDRGSLQALVAIRCLDEGIDVPAIRTAIILASSRNPRQFVQRRGRILRRAPGKRSAAIYDMITTPPHDIEIIEPMKNLMRREIERFAEFADLALNSGEANRVIQEYRNRYLI